MVVCKRENGCGNRNRKEEKKRQSTHDISLRPNSNQTINMLRDRHQNLPSHMPTLLGPRRLVLDMDTRGALLHKQLRELHDCGQAAVARIGVGDDRAQVVDVGQLEAVGFGFRHDALFALLAVVEELRHEEVVDFVGDGGLEGRKLGGWFSGVGLGEGGRLTYG